MKDVHLFSQNFMIRNSTLYLYKVKKTNMTSSKSNLVGTKRIQETSIMVEAMYLEFIMIKLIGTH